MAERVYREGYAITCHKETYLPSGTKPLSEPMLIYHDVKIAPRILFLKSSQLLIPIED